jgi:OmpA-OmpF porin, OOP family
MSTTHRILPLAVTALLLMSSAIAQHADSEGSKDPAVFTRMPNFFIAESSDTQFDGYDFPVKKGEETETQHVEGHFLKIHYIFDDSRGAKQPSALQIFRNYQAAALKAGGQVLHDAPPDQLTVRFLKGGQETWAHILSGGYGTEYVVVTVEKGQMQQEVMANAEALQNGLAQSGHVEVSGILFDFGRSEVKPESEAAIKEVAKLLQQNGALKVWVVGHTDNVGSAESNVTLSKARAAAVITVLTQKMGVAAARLAPFGAGPYAPVASNATDQGRAQNRRVELVSQP